MIESNLLQPYQLNNTIRLKNRIVMAPMTRNLATEEGVPTYDMANYYERRADTGLIVTEGTIIRPDGRGYSNVPGIYSQDQIAGWQKVTDKVHQCDGKIFLQIWHVGRVSHPIYLQGNLPLSASATLMKGPIRRSQNMNYGPSREASLAEIHNLIKDYAKAAQNAIAAGFDGVEIHGANGYLVDQFLHYSTNNRQDDFGGTPEKMACFPLDIVKAITQEIGADRVGIRLSPGAYLNEIVGDLKDAEVFRYLLEQLNLLQIAYVHTGNFDDIIKYKELGESTMTQFMRQHFQGNLIASGSYTLEQASKGIQAGDFNLIAIGRLFIANPDLINRVKTRLDLQSYNASMLETLY